jgi:serine/threonine-protein kinase RsbT
LSVVERINIEDEHDIVLCRRTCREIAKNHGFNLVDQTRITTAASELARNVYEYAKSGIVSVEIITDLEHEAGIKVIFADKGPGIEDVEKALGEGWTSHKGMGLGLPGSKKLMDEFEIETEVGVGTTITVIKWLR